MKRKRDNTIDHPVIKSTFNKVLIVQLSSPTRLVCMSSLVHDLKEYGDIHVAILVRSRWGELAASIPGVDEVIRTRKNGSGISLFETIRLSKLLRKKHFDVLISPDSTGHLALLARLSGIAVRVGYRQGWGRLFYNFKVDTNNRQMCIQVRNQDLLKVLGVESPGTKLRLIAPKRLDEYLDDFYSKNDIEPDEKLVAFCLDSSRPIMRWPTVYFSSLAESLLTRGIRPVLLGAAADRRIAVEIYKSVGHSLPACFSDELSTVTAVLSKAAMVVGGDSGLTHASRAFGIPTVVIFGPSDPRRFHFEDRTRVLDAKLKCRPCSYHGNGACPESHHDCMRLVSPERVLDALREIGDLMTPAPQPAQVGEGETSISDGLPLR